MTIMLPVLEGTIARRILLNFRADPSVIRPLIPKPLELVLQNGFAVIGVCLIRLEHIRPKGMPSPLGLSSENMAHRVAIRFPESGKMKEGVYIWRRDTDQKLMALLGGRLFPGVHHSADFVVEETSDNLRMNIQTRDHEADVRLEAAYKASWVATKLFGTFEEACEFFRKGDCGFSCSLSENALEGMQLQTLKWEMKPLQMHSINTAFFEKASAEAHSTLEFDCALIMRGIPHEWHQITNIPDLAVKRTVRGSTP